MYGTSKYYLCNASVKIMLLKFVESVYFGDNFFATLKIIYAILLQILLRSRAIESQCYVIAAAQVGRNTSKRVTYGHAMVNIGIMSLLCAFCGK